MVRKSGWLPAASTRSTTSPASLEAIRREENTPGRVGVDQHFGEHRRVAGLVAPAVAALAQVEGAQVELIDGVGDEIDQMILRQPIAQRRRQQERLLGLIGPVVCPHVSSFAFPSKTFHYFFVFSVGQTPSNCRF